MLSRKNFLKNMGLGLTGLFFSSAPEAEAQKVRKQSLQKNEEISKAENTLRGAVKITNVRAFVHQKASYVKIETDAGISGWGEGDHEYSPINGKIVEEIFKPRLVGKDPFISEFLWKDAFFEGYEGGSTGFVPGALAGVDNALWDLKGRLLGMPVSKLLGGNDLEKIAVYGSYGRRKKGGFKSPEEMAQEGLKFVQEGYKTIKARMQLYDRDRNPPFHFTYDCIKAVRKAIGDDIELFVDFNNGYTAGKAIELGLKLYEHFNIKVVEEPVSAFDYKGLRSVVEALPCDVNAGEHEYTKWQFRDLITIGNPDCLNLDVIKCSGLTECKKVAAMAEAYEKEIMFHNTRPTLATAATLNLLGSITNYAKVQEFSGMRPELGLSNLFHNALKFENGFLYIPTGIGLGLEVNEKEMERLRVK
jgi:L-alanine-DL-glutamate epimerase-like enolase superfamily enzyme